ncbi:hypothetical protein GQ53DRAFT_599966, partial [Thozetella sp. PMI_491]
FTLSALFGVILFYETNRRDISDPFEWFMDNQEFGVRALFSSSGVAISLLWGLLYSRVSVSDAFRRMSRQPQTARSSILVSPCPNPFFGLGPAILRGDRVVASIAFSAILSKLAPITLSNIPFNVSQTWMAHLVYAWATVGVMGVMIAVLGLWSLFIRYPHMPLDESRLLGAIYYVCDSSVVQDFQGSSVLTSAQRDRQTISIGKKYIFGEMIG